MDEIEVPTLFLCPISLQLMSDPVTVCTGITYDRENIERWLFSSCKKNKTCPVTRQSLPHTDLTPNHTLQRLIQAWCTNNNNAWFGIETIISSPKPTIDQTQIVKLLMEAKKFPEKQLKCLRRLQSIAFESESNKIYLESAGAIDFLASSVMSEAAIELLFHLNPSESHLKNLVNSEGIQFIESLFHVLKHGKCQSRAYATVLLKSSFEVAGPTQLSNVTSEMFVEMFRVLRDQISQEASKAALKLLVELCSWSRNRIKAVEGGEGREELMNHGAGVAVVAKKILRVSHVASDRGVKILTSICRHSATPRVLSEMLLFGAVSKLCLVLQMEGSCNAKERARETLKLHSMVWRNSTCIPFSLLASYP
ncbi:E3 ubiquitin-protein ligase PUB23 [Glycine soja]|nr:E3 ubiquitin-protein ligase PUB23 [Glycine soja]